MFNSAREGKGFKLLLLALREKGAVISYFYFLPPDSSPSKTDGPFLVTRWKPV